MRHLWLQSVQLGHVWLPIVEIPDIPQRTLRRWCRNGKVRARYKKKAWEIYIPALLELEEEQKSGLDEVFDSAGALYETEGPNDIFVYGPKKW